MEKMENEMETGLSWGFFPDVRNYYETIIWIYSLVK